MLKLDKKDTRLLYALDQNCRQSNLSLAKQIGLSKDAVAYRIEKLEQAGLISGYRTLIDWRRLGYTLHRVMNYTYSITKKQEEEIVSFLQSIDAVWGMSFNEGEWDISYVVITKTLEEFYFIEQQINHQFKSLIKEKKVSQIIHYEDLPRNYLVGKKETILPFIIQPTTIADIDELDKQLLRELTLHAREKVVNLARKLNCSSMVIINRIKKLEAKKIIIGYKANLHVITLGRDYYGVRITLKHYDSYAKISQFIRNLPETTAFLYTVGGYDLEFDLEVKDTMHYRDIINLIVETFSDVKDVTYIKTRSYYNLNHMPMA